jgi:hypothetical protein
LDFVEGVCSGCSICVNCNVKVWFSYDVTDGTIEFDKTSAFISDSFIVWDDGYCKFCKKDFQDEGSYCSKECERNTRKR